MIDLFGKRAQRERNAARADRDDVELLLHREQTVSRELAEQVAGLQGVIDTGNSQLANVRRSLGDGFTALERYFGVVSHDGQDTLPKMIARAAREQGDNVRSNEQYRAQELSQARADVTNYSKALRDKGRELGEVQLNFDAAVRDFHRAATYAAQAAGVDEDLSAYTTVVKAIDALQSRRTWGLDLARGSHMTATAHSKMRTGNGDWYWDHEGLEKLGYRHDQSTACSWVPVKAGIDVV